MPRVLVVDAWMPTPDLDSASLRIVNLLAILKESCQVTFAADDPFSRAAAPAWVREAGIEVLQSQGTDSITSYLEQKGREFDVVILSRFHGGGKHVWSVRRFAPQARVVFDTTDLAFLRGFRGAKVTGNVSLLKQALQAKKDELAVAREADCTLVVSPIERELLEKEVPGIQVRVVSLIQSVRGSARSFSERDGIAFVGAFPHHPNVDAMTYFCGDIRPLLEERVPGLNTTIIGIDPPAWLRSLGADQFQVLGQVPDVAPYLDRCRLSIAPIRYGAGVKGKVLLSMSCGVPVVASSMAVEGIPVEAGRDVLVADDPVAFADAVAELYGNEALWNRLSESGPRLVDRHFSISAARERLIELFSMLGVPLMDGQGARSGRASPD